jgi:hypothetical protein
VPNANFNGAPTFQFTVTDNQGASDATPATATITVNSVNDAPVATTASASGNEDAASIPITLTGTDVDGTIASVTLTSLPANGTLYSDAGLTTLAAISTPYAGASHTFYFVPNANFNGAPTFQFTVTDNQAASDATPATATITVNSVNDAPVATTASGSGNEDATSIPITLTGTDVDGTIASVTLTTLPANGTLYTDAGLTTLAAISTPYAGTSHTFYFVPDANFNGAPTFQFTVTDNQGASDASAATATITVNAVNDPPGAITDTNAGANTIPENSANGTAVGVTAHAVDPDGDTVTYSLTDDAGGRFTINGSTGVVTVANGALLDFETNASHNITVQASSTGGTSTQGFTIAVSNVNEPPGTITDTNGGTNTIPENSANGTAVGVTAHAVDPEGDAITYSLTDDAGGRFTINGSTGVVTVADGTLLNFETATSHNITVQASSTGGTSTQGFTIAVSNVNEPPGTITDTNGGTNTIPENSANGTAVGVTAHAVDPEGDAITYSLTDDAGGRFTINGSTGVVTVADGTLLNFETATSHNITVQASSTGGTSTQGFTIAVSNVNEPLAPSPTPTAAPTRYPRTRPTARRSASLLTPWTPKATPSPTA